MTDATVSPRDGDARFLRLTSEISAAYFANNTTPPDQVAEVIVQIRAALSRLQEGTKPERPKPEPAVPVRKSVTPDYLVCLEDGKKLKMLKRYLKARFGMTPEEYRARWNLPADYPMVAPNYAQLRSDYARQMGLGRKGDLQRS